MTVRGVLLKKGVDQTGVNFSGAAIITFNDASTEVYDTDGFHSNVTNAERITIPSAVNGKYGIFTVFVRLALFDASTGFAAWVRNSAGTNQWLGTSWGHFRQNGNGQSSTDNWTSFCTGPVLLNTGDFYDSAGQTVSDSSVTIKAETSFGLYVLDNFASAYCLAKMNADQTAANYSTPTAIAWDGADVADIYGFHSPSVSNTKIIVPSAANGTNMVFRASVYMTNVASAAVTSMAIRKNGSLTYDGVGAASCVKDSIGTWTDHGLHCQTQAIQVAAADEFDVLLYSSDTSVDLSAAVCSFSGIVVG